MFRLFKNKTRRYYIKTRKSKLIKLYEWIWKNYDDWETICGINNKKIAKDEYKRLINLLNDQNFEKLMLVLQTVHFYIIKDSLLNLKQK